MADRGLSSEEWIKRQNAEREERNKSARQKAEEMSEGARGLSNLDVANKFIVEAGKKNMELTDEAHRGKKWKKQYAIICERLEAIEQYEREHRS